MTCQKTVIKLSDLIISKYYSTFNDRKHTHKIFTSGRSGTKSSRAAIEAVSRIVMPEPGSVVILRKFHNKLKKTVYAECLRAISRLHIPKSKFNITISPMQITYIPTGNTIYFTGNDSIDDTKGIIDPTRPIVLVILDELTEFFDKGEGEDELANIEATFIRGNDKEFSMEYYFNPPKNPNAPIMLWLGKMVLREDTIRIHVDYRDVPVSWLGKKLIESAETLKKLDEKMYNWLWLGQCIGLDEIIYYMFSEEKHVKEYEDKESTGKTKYAMNHLCISVDYGQMNATTYQAFAVDYTNKLVRGIDEYYYSGRDTGKQKSPSEYANDFKEFRERVEQETGLAVSFVFIDPSAKGLSEEIKRVCPGIRIINAINDVPLGISRVQKMLSFERIVFSPKQKNLIREITLYSYDEKSIENGKEVPIKVNDHAMDALRYAIMGIWKYLRVLLPFLATDNGDDN